MEFIYKGLKAVKEIVPVTEEEINRRIEQLRQSYPEVTVITNRAAENGDEVILDYAGFCDGVQFEGGTAENQTLILGSGMFIPGFEEQLIGKMPEEPVTVSVTFPEQYGHAALAGKPAEFKCVIHGIRSTRVFTSDEELAKKVGDCDTVEAFREKVAESLRKYYDDRSEMELQDRLIRMAADTLDYAPAEEQIKKAAEEQLETLRTQLAQQGLTMEQYCSFTGMTEQALLDGLRPEAEASLKVLTAIGKIGGLENIGADETEVADACREICEANQLTPEQFIEAYNEQVAQAVARSVVSRKVLRFVRDSAEITEKILER